MEARDYGVLIKRLILAFCLFFTSRLLFTIFNWDYFSAVALYEMGKALVVGLRFDVATVLSVNVFFIILSLIPIHQRIYQLLLKFIYLFFNTVFLFITIIDMKFFSFIGKKMTFDILDMRKDIADQSIQIILNYWYMGLILISFMFCLWKFYPQKRENIMFTPQIGVIKTVFISLLLLVITAIGIRGGVQMRSLSPKQAFVFDQYELGNMTINSAYTMIRSIGNKPAAKIIYFASDKLALDLLKKKRSFQASGVGVSKQNIVILILESFSQEYVDEGYAPFLKELGEQSFVSYQNFANGRRSLEALPSILTGIPSLLGKPLYQTQYQSNQFYALPQILKEQGYDTSFFHGGKKGTMDFDAYCESIGVAKYHSMADYPNQKHYDGHWGIYDHHFLNYFAKELDKVKEPFFTGLFTLSSHQPYSIPKDYQNIIPKGKLEIHQSIRYVDLSLKKFFKEIAQKDWYQNTLFVITADHTQKLLSKKYNNDLGRYRVPLIFFHPSVDLSRFNQNKITQHADILPSVLDFLKIDNKEKLYFGDSVFNPGRGRMVNFIAGRYLYYSPPYLVTLVDNNMKIYQEDGRQLMQEPTPAALETFSELKATIQYIQNGLRENNLYHFN